MTQVPESLLLGVVLERRDAANPWIDAVWRPVEVLPGGPPANDWRLLGEGPGWRRWYAGAFPIELFRKETEGYRRNLIAERPVVYVVLRPAERGGAPVMQPCHVTVDPFEADSYQISGDEVVEGVPMPPEVAMLVQAFVDAWHVDEPFVKRKQKPKAPGHDRK